MKLKGNILLTKRLLEHPVWRNEPKCYGGAWVDLLLKANDADRVTRLNGEFIPVKRGQCAWSLRGLEKEWHRSAEWIGRFLNFCKDESMILVDSNRRRTLITILNYDTYQTLVAGTDSDNEQVTEPGTDSDNEPERKGELGRGSRKGEAPPPVASLIPTDAEVAVFCKEFADLATGIEGIPDVWWTGWLANKLSDPTRAFPRDWKRALTLAFRSDFAAHHPKARASQKKPAEKNAATSPAQALFLVDRELEAVTAEIDSLDSLVQPVPRELKDRRRALQKKRVELTEVKP